MCVSPFWPRWLLGLSTTGVDRLKGRGWGLAGAGRSPIKKPGRNWAPEVGLGEAGEPRLIGSEPTGTQEQLTISFWTFLFLHRKKELLGFPSTCCTTKSCIQEDVIRRNRYKLWTSDAQLKKMVHWSFLINIFIFFFLSHFIPALLMSLSYFSFLNGLVFDISFSLQFSHEHHLSKSHRTELNCTKGCNYCYCNAVSFCGDSIYWFRKLQCLQL